METYPVDIAPEQVVRWLMVEGRLHAFDLLVTATRSYQIGELSGGRSARLDEEMREETTELSEIGLLALIAKLTPLAPNGGRSSS